jgi:hypothetical protein|tara:strand:- start:100 stop:1302 length:1203 start_codon:yes stop_codon:yes gene_type:complete
MTTPKMTIKDVVNVVKVAIDKVADTTLKVLSSFNVIDSIVSNLPFMEDILESRKGDSYTDDESIIVSARIGDLLSDPTYNRILELSYGNCERDIKNLKGFSHKAAGVLFAFVRPDGTVVLTQGNNRTTMLWMVTQDPNARIAVNLNFHSRSLSFDDMIQAESNNHRADCANRTTQTLLDKFKSAVHSQQDWAVKMFNLLKEYGIGIADTLPNARFSCKSYGSITKAEAESSPDTVKRVLKEFTSLYDGDQNPNVEILGNFVRACSEFLTVFSKHINDIDVKNKCDSFSEMLKWYFRDMEPTLRDLRVQQKGIKIAIRQNITQEDICISSGLFKGNQVSVCRLVSIYNEFVDSQEWEFNKTYDTAIPIIAGVSLASYLAKVEPILRNGIIEYAKTPVVHAK